MTNFTQPNSRPRLLLLIPHLGGGGAEQVIALLARGLDPLKYDLHLALITQTAPAPELVTVRLPLSVTVHLLGARVILSGMFHLNFLVLLLRPFLGFPVRILIRQNGTASAALATLPRYNRLFYRVLYPRADCVLCQSAAMARDLHESFAIRDSHLTVLPNPIDFDAIGSPHRVPPEAWPDSGPHLLAVGRLSHEKGFDLLLKSLSLVLRQIPTADLVIAGSGAEDNALKAQCRTLALGNSVRFLGHVADPAAWFPAATLFVLSSRHEALPNALLEAAAAGLPIVSTPASQGLVELIRDQPGVWLAADSTVEALAVALTTALNTLRPRQRFQHAFVAPFRMEPALAAWEELIDRFLADGRPANVRDPKSPAPSVRPDPSPPVSALNHATDASSAATPESSAASIVRITAPLYSVPPPQTPPAPDQPT